MSRFAGSRTLLLTAFVVLVVLMALVGHHLTVRSQSDLSCVVEDSCTGGGSGVRDWADRLGYSTRTFRAPIREVNAELPATGNCLMTAGNDSWYPLGGEFSSADWSSVDQWIRAGNTLIVITSRPASLPSPLTRHFTSEVPTSIADDVQIPSIETPKERSKREAAKPMERAAAWWGGAMAVEADGPRVKNLPPEFQLAGDESAAVLAGRPLGGGMVYLLLDERAWTNEGFDQADNAATLARILKEQIGHGGVLAFDEYRHGYGHAESFASSFLSLPGAKNFFLMALAWGLFWLWGSTRRLCPADEYRENERHTALEYIESVAAMNQRARAAPLAVGAVLERVRYLLQKRGSQREAADAILDRAARLVESAERPAVPNREIEMVSEILQLKQEIYGTRSDPRAQ